MYFSHARVLWQRWWVGTIYFCETLMCVVMGLWCDVPTCRTIFYHHPHPSGFDSDNYIKWMSNVMGPRDLNIKGQTIERFKTIIYFKWRGKRERVLQETLNWRWGKFPLTISADNGLHFINLLPDIGDFGICFFMFQFVTIWPLCKNIAIEWVQSVNLLTTITWTVIFRKKVNTPLLIFKLT